MLGKIEQDKNGDANIAAIHRLFAPLLIGGRMKLVKLTVKAMNFDQGNRIYTVETIEVEKSALGNLEATAYQDDMLTSPQSASHSPELEKAMVSSLIQQIQDYNEQRDNALNQTARGQFMLDSNTIVLFENADLSTLSHELGHFFLESMVGFSNELRHIDALQGGGTLTDGERGVVRDVDALMDWFGLDLTTPKWRVTAACSNCASCTMPFPKPAASVRPRRFPDTVMVCFSHDEALIVRNFTAISAYI